MATGSGASSSTGSRGAREGQALCPFCHTATVVERTSRTTKNPDKPFYTCRNRDWGNGTCNFFMWKPESAGDGMDGAAVMAALKALENSLLNLNNVVVAQSTVVARIAGEQIVVRMMVGASVFVGVVCFLALCMVLYKQA
ncbi:unnamed protein product [Miscanthus lutarioriparius]|uniref:GRF-type domain-containing protein n=1 Tax=Miscanthus lutarioriparius TaxID=422564 RepID=A0A811S0G3_9POAL|nr:unnamed protein product [Miscanthus lutarioriparius]